ncbi:60S ribosomal export protein NMD3-like [Argonauta hians]
MEYINENMTTTVGMILCCQCGVAIPPNPSNMCVNCVRTEVDITEGIPKQCVMYFCRKCERYLQPPATWVPAQLESKQLLKICLKKLKGLNKVNLIDAGFIWTEPHSQRIKLKLTIQKEIVNGAVLQQVFIVEFTVHNQMCSDCHRVEAKDFWRAVVQIRQKTEHKKTFYYLEQLLLKHNMYQNTVNIKPMHGGLDFYYACKNDARKIVDFLLLVVPCKYQIAQELLSMDIHSNIANYKWAFSVEIVPVCKDDVVCLPKKVAASLGNISQICVVHRVTQSVHLIDPLTLQIAEVSGPVYWREPFYSLCTVKHLTEYMVMEIDPVPFHESPHVTPASKKHVLSEAWVARLSDLGVNDQQYFCKTHLGHTLHPGDTVLGFHLANSNVNNAEFEKMKKDRVPDVILVKKMYNRSKRNRLRNWKLKHVLPDLVDTASDGMAYTEFLEDLEEDDGYRQNVNIFLDKNRTPVDLDDIQDEALPKISLQEMLEDMVLEDPTGEAGANMVA